MFRVKMVRFVNVCLLKFCISACVHCCLTVRSNCALVEEERVLCEDGVIC